MILRRIGAATWRVKYLNSETFLEIDPPMILSPLATAIKYALVIFHPVILTRVITYASRRAK